MRWLLNVALPDAPSLPRTCTEKAVPCGVLNVERNANGAPALSAICGAEVRANRRIAAAPPSAVPPARPIIPARKPRRPSGRSQGRSNAIPHYLHMPPPSLPVARGVLSHMHRACAIIGLVYSGSKQAIERRLPAARGGAEAEERRRGRPTCHH